MTYKWLHWACGPSEQPKPPISQAAARAWPPTPGAVSATLRQPGMVSEMAQQSHAGAAQLEVGTEARGPGPPAQFLHVSCTLRNLHRKLEEKKSLLEKNFNCERKHTVKWEQNHVTKPYHMNPFGVTKSVSLHSRGNIGRRACEDQQQVTQVGDPRGF